MTWMDTHVAVHRLNVALTNLCELWRLHDWVMVLGVRVVAVCDHWYTFLDFSLQLTQAG